MPGLVEAEEEEEGDDLGDQPWPCAHPEGAMEMLQSDGYSFLDIR